MSRAAVLTTLLEEALEPSHLQIENESGNHSVPKGSETHFKVVVVSPLFEGKNMVARHQLVYAAVDRELKSGLHALAIVAKTPAEWERSNAVPASPACAGGSLAESKLAEKALAESTPSAAIEGGSKAAAR